MYLLQKKYKRISQSAQACKSLCSSGFGGSGNQLLAAANANNAENAGVRCANTNNRGATTNANYGFPLLRLCGFPLCCGNTTKRNKENPNCRHLAPQKLLGYLRVLIPILAHVFEACKLAKEYEVRQRLVEGCKASAKVLFRDRHNTFTQVQYGA